MSTADRITRHISVRGRVQGVGYRAFVHDGATLRGIEGFVRNRRDGSVEALLCGTSAAVADMLTACRRGPPASQVTAIEDMAVDARLPAQYPPGCGFTVLPLE